jgi:hypothetical protein
MKKIPSLLIAFVLLISLFATPVSAAPGALLTPTPSSVPGLGQLKVCKSAGAGVTVGQVFTINVNNTSYSVPAGPSDGGYCVLAGQFPLNAEVTVQEVIPAGYHVSNIEIKPDRALSKDAKLGKVIVEIGSGVTEVIFTNRLSSLPTQTPGPTNTPTATPRCAPNCTPTPTPTPKGRLQICKEADGAGVSGYFRFNFANKSKSIPVGACSSLITVEAGSLTIVEEAQAGYSVTDVYTIPANRLISKNLSGRSATVTIVQGNASSQTIVVFRNRAQTQTVTPTNTPTGTITPATSTPTGTITPATNTPTGTITPATSTPTGTITPATNTPTGTITPATNTPTGTITPPTPTPTGSTTPPVCTPVVVTANFSQIAVGGSIEGLGAVAPNLNIDAIGTAVHVVQGAAPAVYASNGIVNGGMVSGGGFGDPSRGPGREAHQYTFTFAQGTTVSNFSLRMLDFGDFNPTANTSHLVTMTAYNASNFVVSSQQLSYTTVGTTSPQYGNMFVAGDAIAAQPGQPGNWTWNVSGSGIARVVLEFGLGHDPNIGFDTLTFTTECVVACQTPALADFSQIAVGASVEGLGVVAPDLNINGLGTAVHIVQGAAPGVYASNGITNGGMVADGGFSDPSRVSAVQTHQYTFTFAPGVTVSNFSLHMLDFGDFNPTGSTSHLVTMTAFNASNGVVSSQPLSYTTVGTNSPQYGNMLVAGDAIGALPGQPGNWTWSVSGNGIVRVVLQFGAGHDPNVGFDLLGYCPQ